MNSPKLQYIVEDISAKNPIHGKRLRKALDGLHDEFYDNAEAFFVNYEKFATSEGKDLTFGIDSYLRMLSDMMNEYLNFARTGEYTCKSFDDAYEKVYNNPDVMEYYMHGLLMSQYLWKHHHSMVNFFKDGLKSYNPKRYLEIGGGHGLYLSKAIEQFGDSPYYEMVDISKSSLEMAKSFVPHKNITYKLQNIYDYNLDSLFDFITMGEVLEHVEDPVSLLTALGKLLTDDGTVFITTPTNAPAIDHIYLFRNAKEIEDVIEKSGFRVIEKLGVYSEDVSDEEGEKRNIAMLYGAFLKKNK